MNETVQFLERHDYWLLLGAVLGRQACLPIPANLLFVAAGALARSGRLSLTGIFALSVLTFLCADLAWYEAGRRLGDRMLHLVCGFNQNPLACARKATGVFSKHGVQTLLFSKFVPGFDAVAAPLAGRVGVPAIQFVTFDALGAGLWIATYTVLGYIFRNQLDLVAMHIARLGAFVVIAVAAGLCVYFGRKFARWHRFVREFRLARITPEELSERLNRREDILVMDVQGSLDSTTERMAIPGAICIEPRALLEFGDVTLPPSREVVLYCACPGEYTSARVALVLRRKGIERVRPLAGGLKAWRDCGFPVTSRVRILTGQAPTNTPPAVQRQPDIN